MWIPSKLNRRAEKYEGIGLENPTVGIASSWENVGGSGAMQFVQEYGPDQRIASRIPADEEWDDDKKSCEERHTQIVGHV